MSPTLLADAFGRITPIPERVAPDPEYRPDPENPLDGYLWGAFRNRSEHMRWSTDEASGVTRLWNVEEAELTFHIEESRIGFAQVGLDVNPATPDPAYMVDDEPPLDIDPPPDIDLTQVHWAPFPTLDDGGPPTNPAIAISPLVQCLDDSLRWFGQTEISAWQVTGLDMQPEQRGHFLSSVLAWFSVVIPTDVTPAVVTMASSPAGDRLVDDALTLTERAGRDFFEIGPLVDAPQEYDAGIDRKRLQLTPGDAGISVKLPE